MKFTKKVTNQEDIDWQIYKFTRDIKKVSPLHVLFMLGCIYNFKKGLY